MSFLQVSGLSLRVPGREILTNVSLDANAGEVIAIMGPSGSGKTSLLNCVAGITRPTSGSVTLEDTAVTRLGANARAAVRLHKMGFVFQFGELLDELSVLENVALPLRLQGMSSANAERRALVMLRRLDVAEHTHAHPESLSGGEIQRVGVARALVHQPTLVLADEPTGALDEENAEIVSALLMEHTRTINSICLIATHDSLVARHADRTYRLRQGVLQPEPRGMPNMKRQEVMA